MGRRLRAPRGKHWELAAGQALNHHLQITATSSVTLGMSLHPSKPASPSIKWEWINVRHIAIAGAQKWQGVITVTILLQNYFSQHFPPRAVCLLRLWSRVGESTEPTTLQLASHSAIYNKQLLGREGCCLTIWDEICSILPFLVGKGSLNRSYKCWDSQNDSPGDQWGWPHSKKDPPESSEGLLVLQLSYLLTTVFFPESIL